MRTSELIQRILSWMLKESNLLDYYALASPKECSNYVMFTADNLDTLFKDIQLQPIRDQKGVIYFRKIDELRQMPLELEKKRKETCYHIAYFFIRILQVFAALALSVMDTEIPSTFAALESQVEKRKDTKYISPEEFKRLPLFAPKEQQEKRSFWGGSIAPSSSLYIRDINYSILNRYLTSQTDGYLQLYDESVGTGIKITQDSLLAKRYAFVYKMVDSLGKRQELVAHLTMQSLGGDIEQEYLVKLDRFYLNGTAYPYVSEELKFRGPAGTDPMYRSQTIPRYIKNQFFKILGKPTDGDVSDSKTIKSYKDLPKDIDSRFQIQDVWRSLSANPPVKAYCVARALQLLSPEAIYDTSLKQAARTSICNTKFVLQQTESVPKPGGSVTSSLNLLSLNLLFYDILENTIPSIKTEQKQEYRDFLNFLRNLYEEGTEAADKDIKNIHKNILEIRDKTNPVLCAGKTGPLFTKDSKTVSDLRSIAKQMIDRQITHTGNVVKVLEQLFIIKEGQGLLLRPEIQEGGMEAVNKVAEIARNLLVNYYGDCEKLYRNGVIVAASRKNTFKDE